MGQSAVDQEGVVVRASEVAAPEIDGDGTHIDQHVGSEGGVELLRQQVVGLPVGLALSVDIEAEGDAAEHTVGEVEAIVGTGAWG